MAKAKPAAEGEVKVRILTACEHGKANDVVVLSAEQAASAEAGGIADSNPAAVAYAESIAVAVEE